MTLNIYLYEKFLIILSDVNVKADGFGFYISHSALLRILNVAMWFLLSADFYLSVYFLFSGIFLTRIDAFARVLFSRSNRRRYRYVRAAYRMWRKLASVSVHRFRGGFRDRYSQIYNIQYIYIDHRCVFYIKNSIAELLFYFRSSKPKTTDVSYSFHFYNYRFFVTAISHSTFI